jgi:hypothetical protein
MNGGDMERSYSKDEFPAFEKIDGAKVVVGRGRVHERLAILGARTSGARIVSGLRTPFYLW